MHTNLWHENANYSNIKIFTTILELSIQMVEFSFLGKLKIFLFINKKIINHNQHYELGVIISKNIELPEICVIVRPSS